VVPAVDLPPPRTGTTAADSRCNVTELFAILGQPHMLELLALFRDAGNVPLRFSTIQRRLTMSPKTLAVRLRVLVGAGLLDRHAYRESPPRVEYVATSKAAELDELFAILRQWAGRHTLRATGAPAGRSPSGRPSAPA
jgi:DNA-binding HxlR family transcriptional regulator